MLVSDLVGVIFAVVLLIMCIVGGERTIKTLIHHIIWSCILWLIWNFLLVYQMKPYFNVPTISYSLIIICIWASKSKKIKQGYEMIKKGLRKTYTVKIANIKNLLNEGEEYES